MDAPENNNSIGDPDYDKSTDPERIKVVDRKGNVKVLPRSEYEAKKRRSKKRESSNQKLPVKEVFVVLIILAAIVAASYLALHLVK